MRGKLNSSRGPLDDGAYLRLENLYAIEYPADDRNGHAVAEGLVARTVCGPSRALKRLACTRRKDRVSDQRVIILETLQALAFAGDEAAHGRWIDHRVDEADVVAAARALRSFPIGRQGV